MHNCSKRKHSCIDCQHFHPSETVSDGWNEERVGNSLFRTPKYKEVPRHCDKDNEKFLKWWEENKDKPSKDVEEPEECFELADGLKPLEEMIMLANEILKKA
jgi:L-rhamnose isomerase